MWVRSALSAVASTTDQSTAAVFRPRGRGGGSGLGWTSAPARPPWAHQARARPWRSSVLPRLSPICSLDNCHRAGLHAAVTIGLWAGGRFKATDVLPYILTQVAGAIVAAAVLYVIASGKPVWVPGGFASNGYGDLSPGKYGLVSCFLSEVIATFFFLYVIIGNTSKGAAVGFAGLPIGLCLTLIHLDPRHQRLGQSGANGRWAFVIMIAS
jgi:hypothetical protein